MGLKRSYSFYVKHRYVYVYTVHKEIYSCATEISWGERTIRKKNSLKIP